MVSKFIHRFTLGVLCVAFPTLANDSLIFEPIVWGTATQVAVKSPPTTNTWPGWCGVRTQQTPGLNKQNKFDQQSYYITTDGQRIAGRFEMDAPKASWRNNVLLSIPIDLEKTQAISSSVLGKNLNKSNDTIYLVNNDRLDGFLDSIDMNNGVGIELSKSKNIGDEKTKNKITYIALNRVAEIRLATKPQKPSGWRVWLQDGSVLDFDSWSDDHNQCCLGKPHAVVEMESATVAWNNVLAIAPNTNTIYPLVNCAWKVVDVDQVQNPRLSPPTIIAEFIPTAFDATPMNLHGPGVFKFTTPRANCTLSTVINIPNQLAKNTDCRATIECGDKIIWQANMNSEFKPATVRLLIPETEFTVRLDQSKHGALGCAIQFTDAILISDTCGNSTQPSQPPPTAPIKSDV